MAAYAATMDLWTEPYEERDLRSRFRTTHLVVCGPADAPPLVLLHCFFTSLTTWAYNVGAFSRHHRVYALDMMSQPSKSVPEQPITTRDEMAEWLTATVNDLGLRSFDLVGYSYGGFAALNYAVHAPDRVRKLVLLSPVGGLVPPKRQFYVRGLLSALLPAPQFTTNALWFNWFCYRPNLEDARTRLLFDRLSHQFSLGTKHFRLGQTVLPSACPDEELRSVRNPTLLLVGQQEALYDGAAAVARARALIPDVQAELIPHAGHDLPVSLPDVVNPRVQAFLGGEPASESAGVGGQRIDQEAATARG
jgi:pimeloyl-ACP methyl ester carboxylesterase